MIRIETLRQLCAVAGISLCIALLFTSGGAFAQQSASVRAVEHPEFSRIVLSVPSGARYAMSSDAATARVRLTDNALSYDFSGVFDRMPRDRIRSVEARASGDATVITLALGCACDVSLVPIGSGYLAIDVRRKRAASGFISQTTRLLADDPAAAPEVPASTPPSAAEAAAPTATIVDTDDLPDTPPPVTPVAADPPMAEDPVVAARRALVQQLDRAVAQGLLSLAPVVDTTDPALTETAVLADDPIATLPSPVLAPSLTASAKPAEPAAADAQPDPVPNPDSEHISIRQGLASREPEAPPANQTAATPDACRIEGPLNVSQWPKAQGDVTALIGEYRLALVDPSGAVDPSAVERLAQFYIALGFGREAEALLRSLDPQARQTALLSDLARVVEGRAVAAAGPLVQAQGCTGRSLLWRAAAGLDTVTPEDDGWTTLTTTLMDLPPVMRRLLGQNFARSALQHGQAPAARAITELLDRTPGPQTQAETRLRAALALAEGKADKSLAQTTPLLAQATNPDPETLLIHARALIAQGVPADAAALTALDTSIAILSDRDPMGELLRLARAELFALSGTPLAGLAVLQALPGETVEARARIRGVGRNILAGLDPAARATTLGVEAILQSETFLTNDAESRALRLDYAQALIEGGLPNAALTVLNTPPGQLPDRPMRMAAAAAHMAQAAYPSVLSALEGLTGPQVDTLRAQALFRSGDILAAYRAIEAQTPHAMAEREKFALLSGQWSALGGTTPFAGLASYATAQDDEQPGAVSTLATAEQELSAAKSLRSDLSNALSETDPDR